MNTLPYYADDPLMEDELRKHRMQSEKNRAESARLGFTVYDCQCPCGWTSPKAYDYHGYAEEYDHHMRDVQMRIHAEREGQQ